MLEIPELQNATLPAILFSGGKDSLLLLDMARQIRPDTAIVHFYDQLSPQVEDVIKGRDLEILSWRPTSQYLIPWHSDLVLVSEYSFGDARLPVLTDIVDGEDCQLEKLKDTRTPYFDYPFDLTVWGYRRKDELHPIMPSSFPRDFQLGPTRMISPLYEWETEDVVDAVARLPFPPVTNDAIRMCEKCREGLATWDREATLKYFGERFGYLEAA